MQWQSEQERREAKSIYHSEKEDSYIPITLSVTDKDDSKISNSGTESPSTTNR